MLPLCRKNNQTVPQIFDDFDGIVFEPDGFEPAVSFEVLDSFESLVMEVEDGVEVRRHVQVVVPAVLLQVGRGDAVFGNVPRQLLRRGHNWQGFFLNASSPSSGFQFQVCSVTNSVPFC